MKWTPLLATLIASIGTSFAAPPKFRAETIDPNILIGYGLAIGDVNGDGKVDILLADKFDIVWYESPTWTKHVMASKLTLKDNVCELNDPEMLGDLIGYHFIHELAERQHLLETACLQSRLSHLRNYLDQRLIRETSEDSS